MFIIGRGSFDAYHEKEIQELKAQVVTHREIAERLGLTGEQGKEFFHRKHKMEKHRWFAG